MTNIQKGMVEINGTRLYYEEAGQGFPLVLLHAGIADRRMWDGQFEVFAKHYRTIRYDMRGFGQSQIPPGAYAHRSDLYQLLRSLGIEKAYFVGCSQGAKAATDFTLEHPEMTAGLVLVGPALSGYQDKSEDPPLEMEIEAAEEQGDLERVNELEVRLWVVGQHRGADEVDPAVRSLVLEMNRIALDASQGAGEHLSLDPPAVARLGEIRVPTLVIYGDLDLPQIIERARFLADGIPGAKLVVLTGTAHLPNMERPEAFNQIVLSFLESVA